MRPLVGAEDARELVGARVEESLAEGREGGERGLRERPGARGGGHGEQRGRGSRTHDVEPEERGIFPLDDLRISRSLRKRIRQRRFDVRVDTAFNDVIAACAEKAPDRKTTWINQRIKSLYGQLYRMGCCHSIECWRSNRLVGGLYGVRIGGAFFGESMFSREPDASKVALVHLVARLKAGGFHLLDAQFTTPHLESLGARSISRAAHKAVQVAQPEASVMALTRNSARFLFAVNYQYATSLSEANGGPESSDAATDNYELCLRWSRWHEEVRC